MDLTREHIIDAIFGHRPIGPPEGTRAHLALSDLSAAISDIKRNFPDFRHRTGGLLFQSLSLTTGPEEVARIEAPVSLTFVDCNFSVADIERPVLFSGLSINSLSFESCRFHSPLCIENTIVLDNLELTNCEIHAGLRFIKTRVGSDLRLRKLSIIPFRVEAIDLGPEIGVATDAGLQESLDRLWDPIFEAMQKGGATSATCRFVDCRIGGVLWISNAPKRTILDLQHSTIRDEVGIHQSEFASITIENCRLDDDLKLWSTSASRDFIIRYSTVAGDIDWRVPGRAEDRDHDGFTPIDDATASGESVRSANRILIEDLRASGSLTLSDLVIANLALEGDISVTGEGIRIERSRFGGNAHLSNTAVSGVFTVRDTHFDGVMRLEAVSLGKDLPSGTIPACLDFTNVAIRDGLELGPEGGKASYVEKCTYRAGIRLRDCVLGKLEFNEIHVAGEQDSSLAVDVNRSVVGSTVIFAVGLVSDTAAVNFRSTDVKGSVEFQGAVLRKVTWNDCKISGALAFVHGRIDTLSLTGTVCDELRLFGNDDQRLDADAMAQVHTLMLEDVHAGRLAGDLTAWGRAGKTGREEASRTTGIETAVVKGFTFDRLDHQAYESLKGNDGNDGLKWLEWIHEQSQKTSGSATARRSKAQSFDGRPWTQLGHVFRLMGNEEASDKLLIDARRRKREGEPFFSWVVDWLLHWAARYGYEPIRTLKISACVMIVFMVFSVYLGMWDEVVVLRHDKTVVEACTTPVVMTRRIPSDFELNVGTYPSDPNAAKDPIPFRTGNYPSLSLFLYHVDTFFPLLDLDMHSTWIANTGVVWDQARNTWILPARPFALECMPPGGAGDGLEVKVRPWIGTDQSLEWVSLENSKASNDHKNLGLSLFWLFTLERIIGGLLTALLIVGLTGVLRKSGD